MPLATRRKSAHVTWTTSFCMTLLATLALARQAAAALPSRGCGKSLSSGSYTLAHGGLTRHYRLFVPAGYRADTASPVVVAFHGWGGNENEFLGNASVRAASSRHGYIVVAPRACCHRSMYRSLQNITSAAEHFVISKKSASSFARVGRAAPTSRRIPRQRCVRWSSSAMSS